MMASNSRINPPDKDHSQRYPLGDPTEAALLTLAAKAWYKPRRIDKAYPELFEFSFDSVRKVMSSIRRIDWKMYLLAKWSPRALLAKSIKVQTANKIKQITDTDRDEITTYVDEMASNAMRNIAMAYRPLTAAETKEIDSLIEISKKKWHKLFSSKIQTINDRMTQYEKWLIYLWVASIIDPPRDNAQMAIQAAHDAKIKVVMITWDYVLTAKAIAEKIGLVDEEWKYKIIHNEYLKKKTDIKLLQDLKHDNVIFARTSPEDKLRIVQLLKKAWNTVAVTWDGINDAPALKNANIWVAMGRIWTDVAKDSSKIILMDDSFATLVESIKEWRVIYKNLTKTIVASMTTNGWELWIVIFSLGIASFTWLPIAIGAVQILAIDLIWEMLPLIALTFDPANRGIMKEWPRKLWNHILDKKTIISLIVTWLYMGALAFTAYLAYGWLHGIKLREVGADSHRYRSATTVTYTTIILWQFFNILSVRAWNFRSLFTRYIFTNRRLLVSFVISLCLVAVVVYVPFVSKYFGFWPLALADWWISISAAIVYVLGREIWKYFFYRKERSIRRARRLWEELEDKNDNAELGQEDDDIPLGNLEAELVMN